MLDVQPTRLAVDLRRAATLATWTDARFLDPLLGFLLPGVGDVLGAAVGLYVVAIGVRHRVPRALIARMLLNLAVDCVGGVIPVLGDIFDVVNRANLRNVRLLERHAAGERAEARPRGSAGIVVAAALLLIAAAALALGVGYLVVRAIRKST